MSGSAERQRKGRRQRKLVETYFTLDAFFFTKRDRDAAAQPRTGNAAVEIVEGQLAAVQRYARGQADIVRQRIRRFEIEQRPEIGAANLQGNTGLGFLRPGLGSAFRVRIEPGSRNLRLEPQRRIPCTRRRALELRRTLAGRDGAIQPEQRQQGAALI